MVASAAARCLLMRTRNSLPCPSCCFCFCCCCFCCCAGREATPAHCCCPACAAKVGSTCAWVWVRPWGAGAGTARQACKAWWVVWLRCSMRRSTRRWRLGMPGAATAAGAAPDPAAADAAAASVAALGRGSPAAPWPRCCCPCARGGALHAHGHQRACLAYLALRDQAADRLRNSSGNTLLLTSSSGCEGAGGVGWGEFVWWWRVVEIEKVVGCEAGSGGTCASLKSAAAAAAAAALPPAASTAPQLHRHTPGHATKHACVPLTLSVSYSFTWWAATPGEGRLSTTHQK
eukprot:1143391-Pelagomonas_calceolata.AAC.14